MGAITISLPDSLAAFVEREVASGAYGSASDMVGEGLRLLAGQQLDYLRHEVGLGLADLQQGRLSGQSVMDILAELEAEDKRTA